LQIKACTFSDPVFGYSWSDVNVRDKLIPQFIKWAEEIASGMAYLGSKKILHVDLACRNASQSLLTNFN
jgi:hypothetical protein